MRTYFLENYPALPLVISPNGEGKDPETLKQWILEHHAELEAQLAKHGAILFRGFDINTPLDFEAVAKTVDHDLKNDYLGTSPRDKKTDYVFSASELPPHYPIMQHCEMSFLPSAPRRLFFFCHIEPPYGGETPICDFRQVYRDLSPEVREAFEKKGVRHVRNYSAPGDTSKSSFQLKKWNEMFLTEDKQAIEEKCKANDIQCEWKPGNGLRLINQSDAIKIHPQTGERVWFNHTQVFHIDAAAIEYEKIHQRQRRWETFKYSMLLELMTWYKKWRLDPNEQSMHVTFGDGSEIPEDYVQHIEDVIWKNLVVYPWRKGDVICIDNFSTSHGRLPYTGPREIMVAWTS